MTVQTLEELKAQNAAEEHARLAAAEGETIEGEVVEEPEIEPEEEEATESEESEETEEEEPEWMKKSEQTFTSRDVAAVRRKYKGQLDEEKTRTKELEQRLQQLEQQQAPQSTAVSAQPKAPKWLDYDTEEDYEKAVTKYESDMAAWNVTNLKRISEEERQKEIRAKETQRVEKAVEQHYERAAELAQKSKIAAEDYQNADINFRRSIEEAIPGAPAEVSDAVADKILANLGDGSEKVAYYIGKNATEQATVQRKLMEDPSGLSLSVYLGELKARFNSTKKTSRATPPGKRPQSGKPANTAESAFKKKYDKATDLQERINIRREAGAAGVSTKNW